MSSQMGTSGGHICEDEAPLRAVLEATARLIAREIVAELAGFPTPVESLAVPPDPWTWRERLWTAPAETRLGVEEVAEALGRSPSWVYRRTSPRAVEESGTQALPCRKLDGTLLFTCGEIRAWLRAQENVIEARSFEPAAWEREGSIHVLG